MRELITMFGVANTIDVSQTKNLRVRQKGESPLALLLNVNSCVRGDRTRLLTIAMRTQSQERGVLQEDKSATYYPRNGNNLTDIINADKWLSGLDSLEHAFIRSEQANDPDERSICMDIISQVRWIVLDEVLTAKTHPE